MGFTTEQHKNILLHGNTKRGVVHTLSNRDVHAFGNRQASDEKIKLISMD